MSKRPDNSESESPAEPKRARLRQLAELAGDGAPRQWRWAETDWPEMWRHQLAVPIVLQIAELDTVAAMRVSKLLDSHPAPRPTTFADLLGHRDPDPAVLGAVARAFAGPDERAPKSILLDVRRALSSLARLLTRDQAHVSFDSARASELRVDATWLIEQPWLDDNSRRIAREVLAMLPT